jgi:hypothetical protein
MPQNLMKFHDGQFTIINILCEELGHAKLILCFWSPSWSKILGEKEKDCFKKESQ